MRPDPVRYRIPAVDILVTGHDRAGGPAARKRHAVLARSGAVRASGIPDAFRQIRNKGRNGKTGDAGYTRYTGYAP